MHPHDHNHHEHHSHTSVNFDRAFAIGIFLNISFVVIEGSFGIATNSLALLADAGHNLSDVLGLAVAWVATLLVRRKPSQNFTFGLRSSSILAALANAVFLLLALGGIAWEAIGRFKSPPTVEGGTVIAVAFAGILINGATAYLFSSGRKSDLNIKGAYLHMLGDALVSAGVAVAGFIMLKTGWNWLDPMVSLFVSLVILRGTWGLLKESAKLALNAVPSGINASEVLYFLKEKQGVENVHDLHIWGMSTTENAMTAHLVMPGGHPGDSFLHHISEELHRKFKVQHSTLQIELGNDPDHPCALESDDVV